MKNRAVDGHTRKLALQVLLGAPAYDPAGDFADLMAEGSADALEVASRAVTKRGVSAVGAPQVSALLAKLSDLYPKQNRRHRDGMSRYFIQTLVRSFGLADVMTFLGDLSAGLACTCSPKHEYQCTCRYGKSKITGRLLDRYFELSAGREHDPASVWSWLKALHFQGRVNADRSAAVKYYYKAAGLVGILKVVRRERAGIGEDPANGRARLGYGGSSRRWSAPR